MRRSAMWSFAIAGLALGSLGMVGGTVVGGEFGPMVVGYGLLTALVRAVPRRRPRDPRARLGQARGAPGEHGRRSPRRTARLLASALSQRLEADDRGCRRRSQIRRPRLGHSRCGSRASARETKERVTPRRSPPMTISSPPVRSASWSSVASSSATAHDDPQAGVPRGPRRHHRSRPRARSASARVAPADARVTVLSADSHERRTTRPSTPAA